MAVDVSSLHSYDKWMACVLVELDVSPGLSVEVEIQWGEQSYVQRLDHLYLPFLCHFCHDTVHLKDRCPFLLNAGELHDFVVIETSSGRVGTLSTYTNLSSPPQSMHTTSNLDSQLSYVYVDLSLRV